VADSDFSIKIREAGTVSLLDVSGRLTSFETGALRDSISRLLKQGRRDIVLNLSGLNYQVFPEFPDEEAALKSFPEAQPKR
jgi:hypothetical protein